MKKLIFFLAVAALLFMANCALAYIIPENNSQAKYFYLFGPKGNPDLGAEGTEQILYIDVPQDSPDSVVIAIYDPDTGGHRDLKPGVDKAWSTVTEFSVYGQDDELLASKKFGEAKDYDRAYYEFGPFSKDQGESTGGYFRFKLVAKTLEGEDENLYNIKIKPEEARAFAYSFNFRLLENQGDKMYFYPEVPAGTEKIIAENYDMDPNGGSCEVYDGVRNKFTKVNDSGSAKFSQTTVSIAVTDQSRRLLYIVTKKTQKYANAGIRVWDDKGNVMPIYFKPDEPVAIVKPVVKAPVPTIEESLVPMCNNKFTFDGTKSYDPQSRKISYHWDFADGSTSEDAVATHTFDKAGEYNVTLTVRNDSGLECDNAAVSQVVKVNAAPEVSFTAPEVVCPGQEFGFDASATEDSNPDKLDYKWDFGDGSTDAGVKVNKAYKKPGTYKVTLTVNDNEGTPCSVATKQMLIKVNPPVIADAGKDIDLCVPADKKYQVKFYGGQAAADDSKVKYTWDFGDGSTVKGRIASHLYEKGGTYEARLSVDDGLGLSCSTGSDTVTVNLNKQPLAMAGKDVITCVGKEAAFDASASYGEEGSELNYKWDFDDGSNAEGKTATHTFKKGGTYEVKLTVNDRSGKRCSTAQDMLNVKVNSQPVAQLKEVKPVCVNSEVNFDASGSNDPDGDTLKYTWDFGDGVITNGSAKASHVYKEGGSHNVTVTVDDQSLTSCSGDARTVEVRVNRPPIADAGPNTVCCLDSLSKFDGSGSSDPDGDNLTYIWDFGDGATGNGQTATHRYAKLGKYTVTLIVKDDSGTPCDTAKDSFEAVVSDKPVSVIKIK